MRVRPLTERRAEIPGGGTAARYRHNGEDVLVRDDAATALALISDLKAGTDLGKVVGAIFVDAADAYAACDYDDEELARLAADVLWDSFGVDVDGSHADETGGARLWDPDEDADRIRASFRAAYGLDVSQCVREIPWDEFLALVGGVPEDTPLGTAMHFRNPKTRPKSMKKNANAQEIAAWDRAHAFYALKGPADGTSRERADKRLTDVFYSLAGGR